MKLFAYEINSFVGLFIIVWVINSYSWDKTKFYWVIKFAPIKFDTYPVELVRFEIPDEITDSQIFETSTWTITPLYISSLTVFLELGIIC